MTPDGLDDLCSPRAYPPEARSRRIDRLETHISWLFLTDQRVYKIKKPVDFGFVDYSSLSRRRHFCQEELRLNRRLAADVYLGVRPVTRDGDGRIAIDGAGEILDYAVEMRRLPASGMLDHRLSSADAEAPAAEIARLLAGFHANAAHGPDIRQYGAPRRIRQLVEENFQSTRAAVPSLLSTGRHDWLQRWSRHVLSDLEACFRQRMAQGRIREGHGDLHAGNICITETGIVIYDCIEFSMALRCGDVACDLAFLCMDLEHAGHWDTAARLQQAYVEASGDLALAQLMPFYKAYRAMVRCKIHGLRLAQLSTGHDRQIEQAGAAAYARLAVTYALGPVLVLCCGLPGTGKTTLARSLARRCGWRRVSSDDTRPPGRSAGVYGRGRYTESRRDAVYHRLHAQAGDALRANRAVVIDASYARQRWRQAAAELAQDCGVSCLLVEIRASDTAVRDRLAARQARGEDSSEADISIYESARRDFEPLDEWPRQQHLILDDISRPDAVLDRLQTALTELAASP